MTTTRYPNPDLQALRDAADLCKHLAATTWPPGGGEAVDMPAGHDEDHEPVYRRMGVAELAALDRNILRWVGVQLAYAAQRVASRGAHGADKRAVAVARALLARGGRRPPDQPQIAVWPDDDRGGRR